ncbi:MAG: GlsB/YeaQ/YmgE family stress response membrane protein [Rhizomicrobium sp.]
MDVGYGILGYPETGLFMMLLIGVIAGWLAEKITASDHGIFTNMCVGIAGAFVGGKIAEILNVPISGFVRILTAATVGAIVLIYVWRAFAARRRT